MSRFGTRNYVKKRGPSITSEQARFEVSEEHFGVEQIRRGMISSDDEEMDDPKDGDYNPKKKVNSRGTFKRSTRSHTHSDISEHSAASKSSAMGRRRQGSVKAFGNQEVIVDPSDRDSPGPHPYGLSGRDQGRSPVGSNGERFVHLIPEIVHEETENNVIRINSTLHSHSSSSSSVRHRQQTIAESGGHRVLNGNGALRIVGAASEAFSDDEDFYDNSGDHGQDGGSSRSVILKATDAVSWLLSKACNCVYITLMYFFYFEKYCLHVERGREGAAFSRQEQEFRMNGGLTSDFRRNFGESVSNLRHRAAIKENSFDDRGINISNSTWFQRIAQLFTRHNSQNSVYIQEDGSSSSGSQYEEVSSQENVAVGYWMTKIKTIWNIFSALFRKYLFPLLVFIGAFIFLWCFGPVLLDWILKFYNTCITGLKPLGMLMASSFSWGSSVLISVFGRIKLPEYSYPVPIVKTPEPSSQPDPYNPTPAIPVPPSSADVKVYPDLKLAIHEETLAILEQLKLTQKTVSDLKHQILILEGKSEEHGHANSDLLSKINEHERRLNSHESAILKLQEDLKAVMLAYKEASTKEKSMEEIIQQVLTTNIGETSDGKQMNLQLMIDPLMKILEQRHDWARIVKEIEIRHSELSKEVKSMQDAINMAVDSTNVDNLRNEIGDITSRLDSLNVKVDENKQSGMRDVDLETLKAAIVPILTREIQQMVATSCETRNCPDSVPILSASNEDIELMIKRAIAKYDADKTGLPDLALESAGGSILSTRCTKSSDVRNSVITLLGFRLWSPPNTPRTIIQPGVVPGECWAFEGSVGDVVIKLAVPALVTGFTLEHIPKEISRTGSIDSAPKHFQVLGLMSEHDTTETHDFGNYTYQDNGEPLQFFPVKNMSAWPHPIVELKILANHGNMRHTCLYRFRVHGGVTFWDPHSPNGLNEESIKVDEGGAATTS